MNGIPMLRVIALCLLVASPAFGQQTDLAWSPLAGLPQVVGRYDDMTFVTPTTGWVVNGRGGSIHKTTDGGSTWSVQATVPYYLRSVGFADEQLGWVGTLSASDVLFETRDGGATWSEITHRIQGPSPNGICGISVVDATTAYAVGRFDGPPIFLRTTDGGQHWMAADLSPYGIGSLIDVHFFDAAHGVIVGGSRRDFSGVAIVATTDDGGATWSIRHRSERAPGIVGEWGWKISFPSRDVGYVSVEYPFSNTSATPAKVLKTTDGGATWSEWWVQGSVEPAGLQGIGFISETVGWAGGRGTTSLTQDGGLTWQQIEDLDGNVNRFRRVSDSLAYAIGSRVYRWSGRLTTARTPEAPLPPLFTLDQNYPNPFAPSTTIRYTLHRDVHVRVRVLDVLGQELRTLVDAYQPVGTHEVPWDGTDAAGRRVAAGAYVYLIDMGTTMEMKTMVKVY